ncbi:MAG TPA: sulfatase-like hydrolase/transferase [Rhodanobacteraceae bacterium]|nr:sulfatase-like hydrolase/transferase [Rhodanobacteraceae bacterium]
MNPARARFLSWHCRREWLAAFALTVLVLTLRVGPLAEETAIEALFATAILLGLAILLVAVTGRIAFGTVTACVPLLLLATAGNLKFQYLSTPLLAPDLLYYANAEIARTLLRYPFIIAAIVAAAVLVPLILVFLWRAEGHPPRRPRVRVARLVGAAGAMVALGIVLAPRGPFGQVYAKDAWDAMNDESFITDFIVSIRNTHITTPAFRTADASAADWHDLASATPVRFRKPDIVAVLEESTFDPRMMTGCISRLCDARMFQPDANTIAHGWLNVHTWGGGTWTSEFAFLTGLPHTLFGPAGTYAPFNLAPRMRYTLPRLLDADGYRTVGIYPTDGDFMNGRTAYTDYGFNAFYGGTELKLDWGATDAQVFAALERVFAAEKAKADGKPLFVMVLTLYQHGPHMTPYHELPAPYDKALFPGRLAPGHAPLDAWLNLNLTNYLQRLSMSDAAMTRLEAFLKRDDRPALLVHFGDHQPSFDGAIDHLARRVPAAVPDSHYVTYYMLKGFNLPIRPERYPVLDIAYLGSLLLDAADLPRDPFFVANTLLRDRCAGQDLDCRNTALRDSYRAWVFGKLDDLQ